MEQYGDLIQDIWRMRIAKHPLRAAEWQNLLGQLTSRMRGCKTWGSLFLIWHCKCQISQVTAVHATPHSCLVSLLAVIFDKPKIHLKQLHLSNY